MKNYIFSYVFSLCISTHVCIYIYGCVHTTAYAWGQRTTCRSQFSPPTTWDLVSQTQIVILGRWSFAHPASCWSWVLIVTVTKPSLFWSLYNASLLYLKNECLELIARQNVSFLVFSFLIHVSSCTLKTRTFKFEKPGVL